MTDLIIAAFGSQNAAFVAGERLAVLQREAGVEPEDIVVVTRDASGRVSVNQSVDIATGKPLGGGQWGMLIGMLFLDLRKGGGRGRGIAPQLVEAGLDAEFLDDVVHCLDAGGGAVGLRVRALGVERVRDRLVSSRPTPRLVQTTLDSETEEAFHALMDQIPAQVMAQAATDPQS